MGGEVEAEKKKKRTAEKNAQKKKTYDKMELLVPKETGRKIREAAEKAGRSKNAYIFEAVKRFYESETGEPLNWEETGKGEENNGSGLRP